MADRIDRIQDDAAEEPLLISDQNQEASNPGASGKMRTCDVCYEESDETSFFGLKCKHDYCQECMKDHLDSNIQDGNVMEIPCMMVGCSITFTNDNVRKFGSKEIYEKFLQFKMNINVDLNPDLKWCPRAGCNRFVKKTGMF